MSLTFAPLDDSLKLCRFCYKLKPKGSGSFLEIRDDPFSLSFFVRSRALLFVLPSVFHQAVIQPRDLVRCRCRRRGRSLSASAFAEAFAMINCLHCFRERSLFGNGGVCLELHSQRFAIGGAFDFLSVVSSLLNSNRAAADSSDAPK
jgi:hypothetical protein